MKRSAETIIKNSIAGRLTIQKQAIVNIVLKTFEFLLRLYVDHKMQHLVLNRFMNFTHQKLILITSNPLSLTKHFTTNFSVVHLPDKDLFSITTILR